METNTPKHFAIQLGALIALYVSTTALVVLLFSTINLKFPDEAAYYWEDEGAREAIRVSIATLTVFFPAFLLLTRISNKTRREETGGSYTTITRWLVYLSLLVAGGVMLGDLVVLLIFFLEGEITIRFMYKVVALLVVVGLAFQYYILDVRGYFKEKIATSLYFAAGAVLIVSASLLYAFSYIETPEEVRQMRLDEQQVHDLQSIHWQVQEYYRLNDLLPETIESLYRNGRAPTAPTGRADYTYVVVDVNKYKLCATFEKVSPDNRWSAVEPASMMNNNWHHEAGNICFDRIIEKDMYPELKM